MKLLVEMMAKNEDNKSTVVLEKLLNVIISLEIE